MGTLGKLNYILKKITYPIIKKLFIESVCTSCPDMKLPDMDFHKKECKKNSWNLKIIVKTTAK